METFKLIVKCILGFIGIIIAFALSPLVLGFVVLATLGVIIVQCLTFFIGELIILLLPNKKMSDKTQYILSILLNMFPKIIHLSETTTKEKLIMLIASIVGNVFFS